MAINGEFSGFEENDRNIFKILSRHSNAELLGRFEFFTAVTMKIGVF
jgi:hypothetical protein